MLSDKSTIKRLAYQHGMVVSVNGLYVMSADEFEAYTRTIEQATREQLLAGVEVPEPFGTYFGTDVQVNTAGGPDKWRERKQYRGSLYTADQLSAAVAKAKAEQREADAKVCEGYALRTRGYLDDDMTACKLADSIREGGG